MLVGQDPPAFAPSSSPSVPVLLFGADDVFHIFARYHKFGFSAGTVRQPFPGSFISIFLAIRSPSHQSPSSAHAVVVVSLSLSPSVDCRGSTLKVDCTCVCVCVCVLVTLAGLWLRLDTAGYGARLARCGNVAPKV